MNIHRLGAQALLAALLAAGVSAPARALPGDAPATPKVLLHGNYCGPGNNAPLAPVDALDAACARHDACTPDGGLPSKGCNLRLQADAERVARDPRQPSDLRALAGLVASGAAMMPFDPAPRSLAPAATGSIDAVTVPQRSNLDDDPLDDEAGPDDAE